MSTKNTSTHGAINLPGTYLGASFALKTFVEIRPAEFAIATKPYLVRLCVSDNIDIPITAATTALLDSLGVLLEYLNTDKLVLTDLLASQKHTRHQPTQKAQRPL